MFLRENALRQLDVSPEQVVFLLISLNTPMVALEDSPTQEAEATISTVRRESDMVSTFVHLTLKSSGAGIFYRYESDPYPEDLREPVESAALAFTESLGFIMEDARFGDLDAEGRKTLLERAIFTGPRAEATADKVEAFRDPTDIAYLRDPMEEDPSLDPLRGIGLPSEDEASGEGTRRRAAEESSEPLSTNNVEITLEEEAQDDFETDLDRAIDQFMGPVSAPAMPPTAVSVARAPLSRFGKRPAGADIYTIHGLSSPTPEAAGPASIQAASVAPPEPDDAPEVRARRAKARFLAFF